MKAEGTKSCDSCESMKATLDEHTGLLKQLKASNDQLSGIMNKLVNSNVFKSFEYVSVDRRSNADDAFGSRSKRARESEESVPENAPATASGYRGDSHQQLTSSYVGATTSQPVLNRTETPASGADWQLAGHRRRQVKIDQNGTPRVQNTTSKRSGAYDEDKRKKVKHITKNLAVGTCTIIDGCSKFSQFCWSISE